MPYRQLIPLVALALAACEGPSGAIGPQGQPGEQGVQGAPGLLDVVVKDATGATLTEVNALGSHIDDQGRVWTIDFETGTPTYAAARTYAPLDCGGTLYIRAELAPPMVVHRQPAFGLYYRPRALSSAVVTIESEYSDTEPSSTCDPGFGPEDLLVVERDQTIEVTDTPPDFSVDYTPPFHLAVGD